MSSQIRETPFVPEWVAIPPLQYDWDHQDPYNLLGNPNKDTINILDGLSDRAQIAYSIGCAEWVAQRLRNRLENDLPFFYIEACWAFEMDKRIPSPVETVEKDWQGIVLAPMDLALMTILNTYYMSAEGSGAVESAYSECIPLHILDNQENFLAWRKSVLSRLSLHYARSKDDPWGEPVPREALDPRAPLTEETKATYVGHFLARISSSTNPLISYNGYDNSTR